VAASDAEVEQSGVVAEGDLAGGVDTVAADSVLGGDGDGWLARFGFGAGGEGLGGGASAQGPVGSDGVVVGPEPVELGLELGEGGGWRLFGQPFLEGLVEAFDLAASLGVVGAGVLVVDA
jgi:hypothetical protein